MPLVPNNIALSVVLPDAAATYIQQAKEKAWLFNIYSAAEAGMVIDPDIIAFPILPLSVQVGLVLIIWLKLHNP